MIMFVVGVYCVVNGGKYHVFLTSQPIFFTIEQFLFFFAANRPYEPFIDAFLKFPF